ncbi:hypothetical protein [Streptomyces dysideae]|uniref:Uncharacterized protein n=1 Tax=Streptomyces dysideae TaxID=909626 RepID=A0A101USW0_9ACTN|nr:hypothetical protein [Streptomyces dysideae]KUO16238.1 hypothetical protein AQJ91_37095 [Streptomyces dysideae]
MRHVPSTASRAATRGLGAVVLLALLALLHAAFSSGPAHLSALDLDGCRLRAAAATAHDCQSAVAEVVTGAGAGGHHDGAAVQSCGASAYGPRALADLSHASAASGSTPVVPRAASPDDVSPAAGGVSLPGAPSGSLVLRC